MTRKFYKTLFFRVSAIILSVLVLIAIVVLWIVMTYSTAPQKPEIVADDKGGAIVAWFKKPGFAWIGSAEQEKLYIQHVNSRGESLWGKQGKEVYAPDIQPETMHLCGDHQGGAVIAWSSNWRPKKDAPTPAVYVQKYDADGNEVWTRGGIKVSPDSNANKLQYDLLGMTVNNSNSIFLVWQTEKQLNDISWEMTVYVQKIDGNGKCSWGEDGKLIQNTYSGAINILSDRSGNLVIIYAGAEEQQNNGTINFNIYAQKFDAAGNPLWNNTLPVIQTGTNGYLHLQTIDNGYGNLLIAYTSIWKSSEYGNSKVYLQKIDPNGKPLWDKYEKELCQIMSSQTESNLVGDGNGGCITTWHDTRDRPNRGVYAQRIDTNGNPMWKPEGVAIWGTTGIDQSTLLVGSYDLNITSDNDGGSIIVWQFGQIPPQSSNYEGGQINAQKLSPNGGILWGPNGVSVYFNSSIKTQRYSNIISDGGGGVIICSSVATDKQSDAVFLQKIDVDGKRTWGDEGIKPNP